MATYFHGAPEMQPDGLQTLYLMNPGYVGYSDPAAPGNMVFLNSTMNSLNPMTISHNPQPNQQQHLVGVPLQHMVPSQHSNRPASIHTSQEVSAVHGLAPRLHYNLWTPAPSNNSIDLPSPSQLGPRRPSAVPAPQQGLSLSLSPQQTPYAPYRPEPEAPATVQEVKFFGYSSSASAVSNVISDLQSFLMGSKYLKAAHQLLDEVVSVGKVTQGGSTKGTGSKSPMKSSRESEGVGEADTSAKHGADLTTAERQEHQMKKAKLVSMLDEVEQRYMQYHHQMQIVVSTFDAVAGFGSARTYTAFAVQTISKKFRCLRDAISEQIRTTSKSLGEEDCPVGGTKSAGSRLRLVDHQLRQQRALQQLGMIQHNAWRPQRGLPERAVSVLRAWLFEHFLHPYPKDADKHILAKQTGLTRSQVSNWFINARVRLWKPMVEEMYLEEFKDQEHNKSDEKSSKSDANEESASKSSAHQERSPTRTVQIDSLQTKQENPNDPKAPPFMIPQSVLGIVENHEAIMQPSPKKTRSDQSMSVQMKPANMMSNRDLLMFMDGGSIGDNGYPVIAGTTNHGGGFGAYSIGEMGRFDHDQFAPRFSGNGVSLTLGLPRSENLSLSGTQPSYLSSESTPLGRGVDMSTDSNHYCSLNDNPTASHPPSAYGSINIRNTKRFAAQLLADFVT